jgi:AP-4 complex subunit sigma-1
MRYLLMVNKQGQTRLSKYFGHFPSTKERTTLEGELIRKCLVRQERQCNFFEHSGVRVVYRRYASLYFIVGVNIEGCNELSVLEFIHNLVETMDKYFENICELDIMFNLEKTHFIIDEMIAPNGQVLTTNRTQVLLPLALMDKHAVNNQGAFGGIL